MKKLQSYLLIMVTVISTLTLSSCDTEEDFGRRLVNGYCWEGGLPIDDYNGWNDYYSRFFFDGTDMYGNGYEEVYRNGRYNGEYSFKWYWEDYSYAVLVLDYGRRWDQKSCIDVIGVHDGVLTGYFYEYLDDYYRDQKYGVDYDRSWRYVVLRTKQYNRYH